MTCIRLTLFFFIKIISSLLIYRSTSSAALYMYHQLFTCLLTSEYMFSFILWFVSFLKCIVSKNWIVKQVSRYLSWRGRIVLALILVLLLMSYAFPYLNLPNGCLCHASKHFFKKAFKWKLSKTQTRIMQNGWMRKIKSRKHAYIISTCTMNN